MSYISLFVALLQTMGSTLTGAPWWDLYLDNLVGVETWFYHASWWIWGIALVIAIVFVVLAYLGGENKDAGIGAGLGCGCLMIVLLTLPLWEWITLKLAQGMASAIDPTGVVNQGQLIMNALLYALLGTG